MPFDCVGDEPGVMTIKVQDLAGEFWFGNKVTPGKSEGQEDIGHNISRPVSAQKSRDA